MIRVAIIGSGAIAPSHIKAYQAFPGRCRVTHLVDLYPEKAEKRSQELGLGARVVDDYRKLLDSPEVDLVSVCMPPSLHAEVSIAFLKAGKHVICEKPMAPSLAECDAMIAAADAGGRVLSAVAQSRFQTPVARLREVLLSGLAGRPLHVQVDSLWWRGHSYYDLWWRGTWESEGGGPTLNHAVHHLDMFQWLRGMPSEVRAVMANLAHDNSEVEDISLSLLRYPDNTLAQITCSVVHHGEHQRLVFQCERASVSFPWQVQASVSRPNGFGDPNPEMERRIQECFDSVPELPHQYHTGQIENVLTAIETGEQPLVDGREGRKTVELITAIYKAAATGEVVKLPLSSEDPWYTREGIVANAPRFFEKRGSVENFADDSITIGSRSAPQQ